MTVWVNNDGLEVRFGSSKADLRLGGRLKTFGSMRELHVKIVGTSVPVQGTVIANVIDKKVTIPSNSYIDTVGSQFIVDTAFVGATATLDIGTMGDDGDGTYTVIDDDGIDAAIAITAIDAVDDTIAVNGAQMGTSPVNAVNASLPIAISYGYNTAALTAGVGTLILKYRPPVTS
jgi:hypothetical protein